MKRRALLLLVTAFLMLTYSAALCADSTHIYGVNWMQMRRSLPDIYSALGYNSFHSAFAHPEDDSVIANSPDELIVLYNNIGLYSGAERMMYSALDKGTASTGDTLRNYFFLVHNIGAQFTDLFSGVKYWSFDSSAIHADATVLSNNEYAAAWKYRQIITDARARPLRLAIKMHVGSTAPSGHDGDTVVSIVLKTLGTHVSTFAVTWSQFVDPGTDYVFFSGSIPDTILFRANNEFPNAPGVELEVHSQRHVLTRIAWVAVADTFAHNLLAGKDLDPTNSSLVALRQHVDSLIVSDAALISSLRGAKPYRLYLSDEPFAANYLPHHRVDSLIGYKGITEVGYPNTARYVAQAQPRTLWSGGFGTHNQVCAYQDTGYHNYFPPTDSTDVHGNAVYCDSTRKGRLRTKRLSSWGDQWGYLPEGKSRQDIALSTNYSPSPDDGFDVFDFRQGTNIVAVSDWWRTAREIDSLLYLSPLGTNPPRDWRANIFSSASLKADTLRAVRKGFFVNDAPAIPEQLSMISHIAVALGARGLHYFRGPSETCDDDIQCMGMTDSLGGHDSDWNMIVRDSVPGDRVYIDTLSLPTMYARRARWAMAFSSWLKTYGQKILGMKWIGASTRIVANIGRMILSGMERIMACVPLASR